jgi:hypothetical protein
MSTITKRAPERDGSWLISIGSGIGGAACLFLTGIILHAFGQSLGTTAEQKALLSWASVTVHILGFVLMGLALGHFLNRYSRNWLWAIVCGLVMISAGGFTLTNLYGFAAGARISATKAVEDAKKRADDAIAERIAAAKRRQDVQERLASSQLKFMQLEVQDSGGKARRQATKDFAKNSATIIAEMGKEAAPAAPVPSPEAAANPDEGAAQLAEIAGLTTRSVQVGLAMWIAKLLVVLEMVLWPLCSFTIPRRVREPDVIEAQFTDLTPQASPPSPASSAIATEKRVVEALPAPVLSGGVPPAASPIPPTPIEVPQAAKSGQDPGRVRPQLIPGAEQSLRSIGYPIDGKPLSPLRERIKDRRELGTKFVTWAQAHALHGHERWGSEDVPWLYAEFCGPYCEHGPPGAHKDLSEALDVIPNKLAYKSRPVKGKTANGKDRKPVRYSIAAGKYPKQPSPKPQAQPEPETAKEGRRVVIPFSEASERDLSWAPLMSHLAMKTRHMQRIARGRVKKQRWDAANRRAA